MDDRRIDHFLTLANQLSFSKAAEMLNITQPALSRSIKAMETELGVALFDRTTNKIKLTPVGVFLAEEMKNVKERYDSMISQARSLQSGYTAQLRVGVPQGQLLDGVRQILRDYQTLHPEVRVFLLSESLSVLRSMLDNHSLDFAVGMLGDFNYAARFSYKVIGRVPLRIAVAGDHPLAGRPEGSLSLSDFRDDPFILVPESETPAVHNILRCCNRAGFLPKVVEVPDLLSVILWIEAGYGVAALPESSVANGNPGLKLISVPELSAPELVFVWSNGDVKLARQAFIQYLKELFPEQNARKSDDLTDMRPGGAGTADMER